jgi:hypothetical protein
MIDLYSRYIIKSLPSYPPAAETKTAYATTPIDRILLSDKDIARQKDFLYNCSVNLLRLDEFLPNNPF